MGAGIGIIDPGAFSAAHGSGRPVVRRAGHGEPGNTLCAGSPQLRGGTLRSLSELTYLRAPTIVVVAGLVLLVAAPFAAAIFDRVEPFDLSDPNSEVERAYEVERASEIA